MSTEPLAIEFANTIRASRGVRTDAVATPEALAAWLAAHDLAAPISPADFTRFVTVRDAIRDIAQALSDSLDRPDTAVRALNEASAQAPVWPVLAADRVEERTAAEGAAAALGALARSAIEVLGGPHRADVRACGRPTCVQFFVKNNPRRDYCSPGCANRARVSRHYDRHK